MRKLLSPILIALVSCTLLSVPKVFAQSDLKKPSNPIVLQLRWIPQFQFSGYYAALWKGFYKDAGLDVKIIPGSPSKQPHNEVLSGRAQYGVGTIVKYCLVIYRISHS